MFRHDYPGIKIVSTTARLTFVLVAHGPHRITHNPRSLFLDGSNPGVLICAAGTLTLPGCFMRSVP
jgi:hypothetical protein